MAKARDGIGVKVAYLKITLMAVGVPSIGGDLLLAAVAGGGVRRLAGAISLSQHHRQAAIAIRDGRTAASSCTSIEDERVATSSLWRRCAHLIMR